MNLREPAAECASFDADLEPEIRQWAAILTRYAWVFRYPGAAYEPDPGEANEGRRLAAEIGESVLRRLPAGL